ncbi:MAG: hypothetical protein Q9159_005959 [Coniocarpon cinnabarinum]
MASATTFYDFKPLDKRGEPYPTANLRNKVVLIVNTASKCGFTPQLEELQSLYKQVRESPAGADFEILGFPCNQFNNQSPEDNDETQSFCKLNYGVEFPILGKTNVNGDNAEPLWAWMKKEQPGIMGLKIIKWNFEKFIVGRDGRIKGRWASTKKPLTLMDEIKKQLQDVSPEQTGIDAPVVSEGGGQEPGPQSTPKQDASLDTNGAETAGAQSADTVTPSGTEAPTQGTPIAAAPAATSNELGSRPSEPAEGGQTTEDPTRPQVKASSDSTPTTPGPGAFSTEQRASASN